MREISDDEMEVMHELSSRIARGFNQIDTDIRDLNNLIHFIKGDGIRTPEFIRRHQ